jgi:transcription elongation factor Elf1
MVRVSEYGEIAPCTDNCNYSFQSNAAYMYTSSDVFTCLSTCMWFKVKPSAEHHTDNDNDNENDNAP